MSVYSSTIFICIRSFLGIGQALGHPFPLSALPQMIISIRSTSIDFAENQLFPSLISLSPLATSHPRVLQHTWVQPSKMYYHFFNLLIARSLGFGSNWNNSRIDQRSKRSFLTLWIFVFTTPPPNGLSMLIQFTRWPIMQKVHRYYA